jgi:hypothetical protein
MPTWGRKHALGSASRGAQNSSQYVRQPMGGGGGYFASIKISTSHQLANSFMQKFDFGVFPRSPKAPWPQHS